MSVLLPQSVQDRWRFTPQTAQLYAQTNFSEAMLNAMSTSNVLRLLRGREEGRILRSGSERIVTYIPFGLTVIRSLRTQVTFGHYASNHLVSSQSFGMGRFNFFFHQLANSAWVTSQVGRRFGVHMVFQDPAGLPNWGVLVRTDFGTYPANTPPNTVPVVSLQPPAIFPYNMFVLPVDEPGVVTRTTSLEVHFPQESGVAFASRLKQRALTILPENSDSGVATDLRLVNLFLVVVEAQRGGGGPRGGYWLTADEPSDAWIVNPRAILSPSRSERVTCFWECLMLSLCMRQERDDSSFSDTWDVWVRDMCLTSAPTQRSRQSQLKRIEYNCPAFIHFCNQHGVSVNEHEAVCVDAIEGIASHFGFASAAVLDVEGNVLVGCKDDLHERRADTNHLVLLLHNGHYSVVMSYTALLPVKECPGCAERFSTVKSLEKHLESKVCLKCECQTHLKSHVSPFASMAAWREHRQHLATQCLFRTRPDLVEVKVSERQRTANRFPHDADSVKRYGRFVKNRFEKMMEEDLSPTRQYLEALFVDLESVVPLNQVEVTRSELRYHSPYAIGWLKRSDAVEGRGPTLHYGMDCMEHFFQFLDAWWDDLLRDEQEVWKRRCREDLILDPAPRTVRGERNYAAKLQMSWNGVIAKQPQCPVCNLSLETHGDWMCECSMQYWSENVALKNIHENFNDNAPRITVWAHNGGRYDWLFVHRYLMERNLLNKCRVVRGGGKYYELAYRGIFLFRDSLNFVMGSLDRLGKDFKVETLKGVFPYRYLQDCSHIYDVIEGEAEVRAALPPSMFEVTDTVDGAMGLNKKRPFTEEEYVEFMMERSWRYDVRVETERYLAADIVCLYQVLESFRSGWKQLPYEPELYRFCTIGQMCHSYFLTRFLPQRCYPTLDVMEDAFIRQALYGGRTEVFERCIDEPLPIHYVDVNSLYPFVMESCNLPSGDPEWFFPVSDVRAALFRASQMHVRVVVQGPEYFTSLMTALNGGDDSIYGFLEVDVSCPPDAMFPILPERRNGKNMFTNHVKHQMVYYSEELKFAIARGCIVLKVHAWCRWVPSKVYAKLITVLKAEKMRGEGKDIHGTPIPGAVKNPSLRAAAKTAQNALYGKSIQFINESVQIVDNQDDLYKLIRTPASDVSIEPIFRGEHNDVVEVTVRPHTPRIQRRSCSAIGTAILAEARMVLYRYFEEVLRVGGRILYCDTDSIVYAGEQALPDHCLSDAVYGKMKVEIPPEEIVPGGFVALAPKCYSFLLRDGSPYVKCKGVNLSSNINLPAEDGFHELLELMEADEMLEMMVGDDADESLSGLSFENLKLMVQGKKKKVVTTQMQFLKTRDRHVAAIDTVKLLTDQFDKRRVLPGGNTVAWNDYNEEVDARIVGRDIAYVSNYLRHCAADDIRATHVKYQDDEWFMSLFYSWLDSHDFSAAYYTSLFLQ